MTGRWQRAGALAVGVLVLGGCGFRGAYSVSLPGGADLGDDPYTVEVEFLDVLDLVPQSGVRVADVPVGRVDGIELDEENWTAVVTIKVNGDVDLPANAVAAIQQSSLLGEKYVELAAPGNEEPEGRLDDGARITLDRTNRNVEVEELLGALSLVLNGGGLTQLQTINRELGDALEGREAEIKDTLDQLDTFIGGLDEQRAEINRALDRVDELAATLAERTATIETALDTIGPGLDVINEQRGLLVSMLEGLARLGDVGTRIIDASAVNTIEDLKLLQPILSQLAAAGPDLANSLELLLTYPFPDSSLSALNYRQAQSGGMALFTNMTATVDLDLTQLLCRYVVDQSGALRELPLTEALSQGKCGTEGGAASPAGGGAGTPAPAPSQGGLPGLGDLPGQVLDQLPQADQATGRPGLPLVTEVGP
ncbi:phospholipid/cholesterol/gamma-HCH transport system substrate-binding protein [Blastococcus aurantiacus]|uniref:Phospholipid/cholesterol/gamma-HCH transport system substrate-binding protein n=1 Tax=Blastococcus aurantiacus TaxID=1550231 RepID=A0A1G7PWY3_9ACTN|nr:MCE family protein [Blastococcus aurantiacus]SDF90745.1 phospholipid/cholesterol/gamma-HCH transport system substrate-binding protein [Blastococcus aurantiacus]